MDWLAVLFLSVAVSCTAKPLNVLFITVDDLRPQFGTKFGFPFIKTPNIDRLASRGTTFRKAYCQCATCGVSRTSFLTGRRPDTTHVLTNTGCFYKKGGNWTSLPHYFKANGYITAGGGKVFHPGTCDGYKWGEDKAAWTLPYFHAPCPQLGSLPCMFPRGPKRTHSWIANKTATDAETPDGMIAANGIKQLNELVDSGKPWFLAVGYHKPHLPHVAPAHYFEEYPIDSITLPSNPDVPLHLPRVAFNPSSEIRSYPDVAHNNPHYNENHTFTEHSTKIQRRAYYATTTFIDKQVGMILDEMDRLSLWDNTVVALMSDHGWHLGENNEWAKHTNFEVATNSPLVLVSPLEKYKKNTTSFALTELVDIYPTLADLAGLEVPPICPDNSTDIKACTEGASLEPLLQDPGLQWKKGAFSQWPKGRDGMGYTIRTQKYRYTEWVGYDRHRHKPKWGIVHGQELYDQVKDPGETVNLAYMPEHQHTVKDLKQALHLGWRHA